MQPAVHHSDAFKGMGWRELAKTFDKCVLELLRLMTDSYGRFQRTVAYNKLAEEWQKE